MRAHIALHIQPFELWRAWDDKVAVYVSSEPLWVRPTDLGNVETLVHKLFRWSECAPSVEHHARLELTGQSRAVPPYALTDEEGPVLPVLWHLQGQGWGFARSTVTHTIANIDRKVLDGRDPLRRKFYLLALMRLPKILQKRKLTSALPSNEPQLYYRILLSGQECEPGLGNDRLKELAGSKKRLRALPLEDDPDAPAPLPPILDEDLVVAPILEPKAKPKVKAKAKADASVLLPPMEPPPVPPPPPLPPPFFLRRAAVETMDGTVAAMTATEEMVVEEAETEAETEAATCILVQLETVEVAAESYTLIQQAATWWMTTWS